MADIQLPEDFNDDGLLPARNYPLTLDALASSMLVVGTKSRDPGWDESWRAELVRRLAVCIQQLYRAGIRQVFVDGSFVTDKLHPGDIDGYFVCTLRQIASRQLAQQLAVMDRLWLGQFDLLSTVPDRANPRIFHRPMWDAYRIDLLPHYGQSCGILDEFGNEATYPAAFRKTRDHRPKGIVRLEF